MADTSRRPALCARELTKLAVLAPLWLPTGSHGLGFPFIYDLPPIEWGTTCYWTHPGGGSTEHTESNSLCSDTTTTASGAVVAANALATVTPARDTAWIKLSANAAGSAVDVNSGGGTGMFAGGYARYLFSVLPVVPTVQPINLIPLVVTTSATYKIDGGGNGHLGVILDGDVLFAERILRGQSSISESATLWLAPLSFHLISKGGSCTASVNVPSVTYGSCEILIDPVLSFDQAAFDSLMGASTFALDEHFAIRLSESLAPVPEPSAVSLLLTGIALLGLHLGGSTSDCRRRRIKLPALA